ncbi:hypothetical protein [Baaleninema sp.]|uniref:hypothetical protein n=1 Tax=Baaleninema sp. TaxID=3101197 RepID=UPI003CFFC2A7
MLQNVTETFTVSRPMNYYSQMSQIEGLEGTAGILVKSLEVKSLELPGNGLRLLLANSVRIQF